MNKLGKGYMTLLICILIIFFMVEGILLLLSFIYADEVECNFLWCTITVKSQTSEMTCLINDEVVDCPEDIFDKINLIPDK